MTTAEALAAHPLLAGVDPERLAAIAERSEDRTVDAGEVVWTPEQPAPGFAVLVEGRLQTRWGVDDSTLEHHTHEAPTYLGAIPILSGTPARGLASATAPSRVVFIPTDCFFDLLRSEPEVARDVFSRFAPVFQRLEGQRSQQEKLAALGGLSAGLAHELNNPASALRRGAAELDEALRVLLCTEVAPPAALRDLAASAAPAAEDPDPLAAADREEAWLAHLGESEWEAAAALAGTDVAPQALPEGTGAAEGRWLAAALTTRALAAELQEAAGRISELVGAVKEYAHLDRAAEAEVDVHAGLDSTLTMLKHRLRGVRLERDYDRSLPRVTGRPSELNQVWTNLLVNALDAVGDDGSVTVRTRAAPGAIEVEVADDGPGVPEEVRTRIFEPFFTTKDVGSGTGLGLDLSWRIVQAHGGSLRLVEGTDGGAVFRVRLPVGAPAG